jgi:hypothetical protein
MEHECHNLLLENKKRCYGCKEVQPTENFCKDKRGIGGYKNYCRSCQRVQRAINYAKNRDKELIANKLYKSSHKEEMLEYSRKWAEENPEKVKARKRRYYLQDMKIPKKRVEMVITGAIRKRIVYHKSMGRFQNILGYTTEELVAHLESLFTPAMNWDNYGSYWHIDHIRPKSWFDYQSTSDDEFRKCWSLSNLQPLEATINCSKQARYEG